MPQPQGNTTWINWSKVSQQVDAASGVKHAPLGPHRMRPGLTYTLAGNLADIRTNQTRTGCSMLRCVLRRKEMQVEAQPLECIAFAGAADHITDFVARYGADQPICLIGEYQLRNGTYRFQVSRSRLPTLHLAIHSAVRLAENFQHCS